MSHIVWALLGAAQCLVASNARCPITRLGSGALIIALAARSIAKRRGALPVTAAQSLDYYLLGSVDTNRRGELHSRTRLRAAHRLGATHTFSTASISRSSTFLVSWTTSTCAEWRCAIPVAIGWHYIASSVDTDVLFAVRYEDNRLGFWPAYQ